MWGRKPKSASVSVGYGDPTHGFVVALEGEGIANTGMDQAFKGSSAFKLDNGSRDVQLGDGSPTGHHIIMSVLTQDTVMILLGSKPRDIGGVVLEYARPESPYWQKVVQVMNQSGTPQVVGIPGIARMKPNGTVGIYVITG